MVTLTHMGRKTHPHLCWDVCCHIDPLRLSPDESVGLSVRQVSPCWQPVHLVLTGVVCAVPEAAFDSLQRNTTLNMAVWLYTTCIGRPDMHPTLISVVTDGVTDCQWAWQP